MLIARRPILVGILIAALAIVTMNAGQTRAETLPAPTGDVILRISGAITNTNVDGALALDADLMAQLPQHSLTTGTMWTVGTATYTGVLLRDLLAAAGTTGTTLTLRAVNDYHVSMPAADVAGDGPLLAFLANGKPLSLRDKGPVWLIYPFDDVPAYRTEQFFSRSIWQLDRIEVTD